MMFAPKTTIWVFINIAFLIAFVALVALGIYVLMLLIKALKVYIKKNS